MSDAAYGTGRSRLIEIVKQCSECEVWVVGDLLHFAGEFDRYVRGRDLTKQEGLIFRHLLRMILLCGEFAQLTPPELDPADWQRELRELADLLTTTCRAVDPESTDKSLESMSQDDP